MTSTNFHFALRRLAQEGSATWLRLVRVGEHQGTNLYQGQFLEVLADGSLEPTTDLPVEVLDLGESPADGGKLPEGLDTVAMDVEGRWVIFVAPSGQASFPARVVQAVSVENYLVREQAVNAGGLFVDAPGAIDLPACNLAERSMGPGGAVSVGQVVIVHVVAGGGSVPQLTYVFDHAVYAKYMD